MEGVSSSCMMGYGDNSNSNGNGHVVTTPMMMMMMPLVSNTNTSSHSSHHHGHDHHGHGNNPNAETCNSPLIMSPLFLPPTTHNSHNHHQNHNINSTSSAYFKMADDNINDTTTDSDSSISSFKAKIMAHPHYHRLLASYLSCQKVGAPPEVVARMEAACRSAAAATGHISRGCLGEDPALDQFMEAYSEMLCKYALEISKPFNEAMLFIQRIDSQFKSLTVSSSDSGCGERNNGSSEEDMDVNNSLQIDPLAEERELKGQLLRRYSGYLGSLKQEFMKKRKKGKLPKEARQQLLDWWGRHYKWPYPSEAQKLALADSTGLDQKQINNWFINQRKRHWKPSEDVQFINQRKRHWKPSEDVQFVVMDGSHPHQYYVDNFLGNPFPMDIAPTML